jgi:hypothetical protein
MVWIMALAAILVFVAPSFAAMDETLVGTYCGTFVGRDDYGAFTIIIDNEGFIEGSGSSNVFMSRRPISGEVQAGKSIEFHIIEGGKRPIIFSGTIDFMNRILGKWTYSDHSSQGSFYAMPRQE